ncbi:MAG: indole-3-glycerol phosphate synthase TrpC [Pyrinomonadaceae bacterium]
MSGASVLDQIIAIKRQRFAGVASPAERQRLEKKALDARASASGGGHAFRGALLNRQSINCIAEFKRASPSKGGIRLNADPVETATAYEAGGAVAISVLTEEDHFAGSLDDLRFVRAAVKIPVLRKDFIVDEFQVYETAVAGADALLLIVAALDDETLTKLIILAEETLGLDALIEVHTADELTRARRCGANIIGINNRNLHTFEVSLTTSFELARRVVASDAILVSESGLREATDLRRLRDAGFSGFLIGESLMTAENPQVALRSLINEAQGLGHG